MKKRLALGILLCWMALGLAHAEEGAGLSPGFQVFWTKFQAGVAKEDKEAVSELMSFPFYLGEAVQRPQFLPRYRNLFTPKVKACFSKAKPTKDDIFYIVYCDPDTFRFGMVNGEWRLMEVANND